MIKYISGSELILSLCRTPFEQKATARLEFSQLLAEYGVPGLIYFILMLKMRLNLCRRTVVSGYKSKIIN